MDAGAVLKTVADTYAGLTSLAVELLITNESEDDGGFHRSEQRARAFYVAPNQVRIEQSGRGGNVTVTNGVDLHQYFAGRYSKGVVQRRDSFPGWFRPEFPSGGRFTFLFHRIAERVAKADLLREERAPGDSSGALCYVLSVEYQRPPYPGLEVSSPLVLWVNSRTHLISRLEGETTHRLPAHDETHTNKQTLAFTRSVMNEPISPETFEFSPPSDAIDVTDRSGRGACISGGGGGGSAGLDRKNGAWFETWNSHDWAGDTLIEQSKLRLHGFDLAFERRLTLSDDRKELRIVELITGPKGQTKRELSIPVA